ncbi:prolipoprotein diacylglyceryl transferase [Euzebya rosea]|uniref:prolipoprotein diacylglyceryl transferase n=1 Tax=Euzebya rosea TaxID=2052804 RepID=UPI001300584A|nr:prolipoprotein diacylglyceryl transferase family protein [Euzebya rosea]
MISTWQLGPWSAPIHDLFVVLGALVGLAVYVTEARRRGMADRAHLLVAAGALVGGVLLAKGATTWRYLLTVDDPSVLGVLAYGGKSILGGLFGAYAGAEVTKKLVGIHHSTGDLFAPAVPAAMAVGRIGCLLTEPLGTPTSLPWGVALSPDQADGLVGCDAACLLPSHPTHAYEIGFHVVSLVAVVALRDRLHKRGMIFTVWLLAYGTFRFASEWLRANPDLVGPLSGSQVFLLVTLPLLAWRLVRTWRSGLLRPPSFPEPVAVEVGS